MKTTVWRLVNPRFVDTAFSGEGARLYGGRWNPKGSPLVYTASTISLATLEMLVQDGGLAARYVAIPATIPARMKVERIDPDDLPDDWRDPEARERLQEFGADWLKRGSSAVLAVPSAVIPAELNYLLNPLHSSFTKIEIGQARDFEIDFRLPRMA